MSDVTVDMSEVRELAVDFTRIPGELARHAVPVLSKGALNIKTQMQEELRQSGNGGFRFVASTVSYDLSNTPGVLEAEIGPSKPAGALANIAYFGTYKGGGTVADPRGALEAEAGNFERELGNLAEELFG